MDGWFNSNGPLTTQEDGGGGRGVDLISLFFEKAKNRIFHRVVLGCMLLNHTAMPKLRQYHNIPESDDFSLYLTTYLFQFNRRRFRQLLVIVGSS